MLEWIKKNQEKVMYGLAILVIILLIAIVSTRSSASREIGLLKGSISALEANLAARDKTIDEEREKYDELTQSYDASKEEAAKQAEEITKLTAANSELSDQVDSLDASLADARVEIDRLDFVGLLREKNIENLTNEVAVLRRVEAEAKAEAAKQAEEISKLKDDSRKLSLDMRSLDTSLWSARTEINRLSNAKSALEALASAKDKRIDEDRKQFAELTLSYEASLSDAKIEIDRLDFVGLLREKNIEDLTNEVAVLRRVEAEAKAEAAKQAEEITKLKDDNRKLSLDVRSLDTSLLGARTEINRLSDAKLALEALASAKDKRIDEDRKRFAELTLSYEASLSDAKIEIDRLDFVGLLREKNIENLTNEVAVLRRVEAESKAEAVKFAEVITKLSVANSDLSNQIDSLDVFLSDAKIEIDRLDFVGLLREKAIEDLMNEVEVLRRVEVETQNEIVRLSNAKFALEADSAAKSGTIAAEREKLGELTRDYEASLADAKIEIDRLDFVGLLREKTIEDLMNEVEVLRRVEVESTAETAKLTEEITRLTAEIARLTLANAELSDQVSSLDAAFSDAKIEINRLEKDILDLRNEVASLKLAEAGPQEEQPDQIEESPVVPLSTESALPAVPDASGTIALKLSDTSSLVNFTSHLMRLFAELSKFTEAFAMPEELAHGLEMLKEFAASTSEMSLLITSSDDPMFYLSFFVDEITFDDFITKRRESAYGIYGFEVWPDAPANGTGWTMKIDDPLFGDAPAAYILKLSGGPRTMVLLSNNIQGISGMESAVRETSPSFNIERATAGESYYQVKLRDGFKVGDIIDVFSFDRDIRDLMEALAGDPERVMWSVSECSWTRDGEMLSFDSFSDIFLLNPEFASARQGTAGIFGDGNLAYFLAADVGFIMRCIFLGASDPAGLLFSLVGSEIAPMFSEKDLRNIVDSGVLQVACVADGPSLSTAYLLLESEAPDVVDRLFSMSYMMGGRHAVIPGWQNAMTWQIPLPGFPDIVLAKNDGALLIGLGSEKSFGTEFIPPDEYKPYLSREVVMSVIVSPRLFDAAINLIELAVIQDGGAMSDADENIYGALMALRDSFDLICARVSSTSNSDGKIMLKEDGDLLGAYLKLMFSLM